MDKYAIDLTYFRLRYYKSDDNRPIPIDSQGLAHLDLTYTDSLLAIF